MRGGANPTLYNGLADFLLGLPQSMGKDLQFVNPASVRMPSWGVYARDQWQISRRLTLNYGMRYEYYPFATRADRGGERYDPVTDKVFVGGLGGTPTDAGVDVGKGQVAPRLGVAYRVTETTVVRAGYGISIDPNSFRNLRDAYPATISSQFSGASTWQAAGSLRTGIPAVPLPDLSQGQIVLPAAVGTQTFPEVFKRGYIQSFNLTAQRDFGAGVIGQAAYVGSRAIRQTANVNINAAGPGGGNNGRALFPQFGRIATINMLMPFNTATYDSLQTQLTRRLSANSMLGVSYTFSKAINYADNSDSGLTWNWQPMWERNRALADVDRPHNLQIYGIYELPFGRGRKWASEGLPAIIAGGWQLNGVFSAMSGTPFTVTSAGTSVNAPGNTQTADQVLETVQDPWRSRPGQQLLRSRSVRAGDRGAIRQQRPQHAARSGSRESRREPVQGFQDRVRHDDAVPRGGVQRHEYAGVQQPRRQCVCPHPRRRWHHPQFERLHRDYVSAIDRTSGPVRPEASVLARD